MEHVLLTGFPGFIAESLIRHCRDAGRDVFWHLIVLPEEVGAASLKLRELDLTTSDYAILAGDITRPDLDLQAQDAEELQSVVERCFHMAALYDLTAPPVASDLVNVQGTRRLVEFLLRCPKLRKLSYVSTCYISGTLEGEIAEDELPEPPEFRNEYERTKHEAERVVRQYADKIPTTIFRPAVVVGDSQTGETAKFDGPYVIMGLFRAVRHVFRWIPNLGFETSRINTVPIDLVTGVISDVGFSSEFVDKTIQIADPDAPTTSESFEAIYHQITGRKCFHIPDGLKRLALWSLQRFPVDLISGIPAQSVDYFQHRGEYRTDNLRSACRRFDIDVPNWRDFYKPVVKFAMTEERHAPNAAVLKEFRYWCFSFRFIYAAMGVIFLLAPGLVPSLISILDSPDIAERLVRDQLFWRPLGISLLSLLFVAVTFLERDPFVKSLQTMIIGGKVISSVIYFAYAYLLGSIGLTVCGAVDGVIALFHIMFYYRLSRIRTMAGSEFRWDPYHLLFPEKFIAQFAETMAPVLDDPVDARIVAETVRANVRRIPFPLRYGFIACCYYVSFLLPCLVGYPPFPLMSQGKRSEFLRSEQGEPAVWKKLPLVFIKLICTPSLYKQEPYLRSIGAH